MRVYVVETGNYSDRHIVGVYTEENLAKRAEALYYGDITEWETDELKDPHPGLLSFDVWMEENGDAEITRSDPGDYDTDDTPYVRYTISHYDKTIASEARIPVWAKDKEHAVKIANEKRIMLQATGEWMTTYKQWRTAEKRKVAK